jgi:glutamate synthase (NADPH/NADH) small chain
MSIAGKEMDCENIDKLYNDIINKREALTPRERLSIPLQLMPELPAEIRKHNFDEVALGYSEKSVIIESLRCLNCKHKPCIQGCPVGIDIPSFIAKVSEGDFSGAAQIIKKDNLLPAVCGRVCPQEMQCQAKCVVGKSIGNVEESVAIGRIERYVADFEMDNRKVPEVKSETGKKVAIVGSGPASLVVAADVRREGHSVTVFEALHKAGGVMIYGIPEFRLPKSIVQKEIDLLEKMGVEIVMNFFVGRTRKLMDLLDKDGFDAAFIGEGAGLPRFMNMPGENLVGVFSANEYLTRVNLMRAFEKKKADTPIFRNGKVAVIGGGNVAMDAARTALRMGADEVNVIYRRTRNEMPARIEEIKHAEEEGVKFHFLRNITKCIGDEEERLTSIECIKFKLGDPDDSGRCQPIPINDSEFIMEMNMVIVAIGNHSNPLLGRTTPGLKYSSKGNIEVDENMKTSVDRIYAAGDIVSGAATVILAMGDGRKAAKSINNLLAG